MRNDGALQNPFKVTTPEDLTVEEMKALFVREFDEFKQLSDEGHMLLKGARGMGKSMLFRYMQVDCQFGSNNGEKFSELKYLGFYIPVKNESFIRITEIKRFGDTYEAILFNEHIMVLSFAFRVFSKLREMSSIITGVDTDSLYDYYNYTFLAMFPYEIDLETPSKTLDGILNAINKRLSVEYNIAMDYVHKLGFQKNVLPEFQGWFFNYMDFLLPMLSRLSSVSGFPNCPIYLMLDDAHSMSSLQTQILNSWIATRTSRKISLKVSTQYVYKTFYTVTGATIDTPHDYKQLDMSDIYTANARQGSYKNMVRNILEKRFLKYGFNAVDPEIFFPVNEEQESKIKEIEEEYILKFDLGEGRGYYKNDDAYRYARADYIHTLQGQSKSGSTYSYAGFNQLVNISSGVIRYYLDAAFEMYSVQEGKNEGKPVTYIEHGVQNKIVRDLADKFLKNEISDYQIEGHEDATPKEDFTLLGNLINALGLLFSAIMHSNRAERRVFSIAITDDELSEDVARILSLGVNYAYLHRSTIGRKERGRGRTWLYVLNRRLAPIWTLDPNSFAGYLFIQNKFLEDAMHNPRSILRRLSVKKNEYLEGQPVQLTMFDIDTGDDIRYVPLEVIDDEIHME